MTEEMEEKLTVLLARIDERTKNTQETLKEMRQLYVTQAEFQPVKRIVFVACGIVLTSVVGALVALVVTH